MTSAADLPMADPNDKLSFRELLFGRRATEISFPELVLAHFLRQHELYERKSPGSAESRFRKYLRLFQATQGRLEDVYWCSNEVSAVGLAVKRRFLRRTHVRIHRVSDWATRDAPKVARMLQECDALAVAVHSVLRDAPQRIALQWTYSLESYLLGAVDAAKGKLSDEETKDLAQFHRHHYARIENYYREAAVRGAQIVYFWGMMLGVITLGGIALALLFLLWALEVEPQHLETFFACYTAGATGAIVSVLQRVTSGHFGIDYELGRSALRRLGSFRPFIGAVFGVSLFFIVKSGIIQVTEPTNKAFSFFVILAFLAGFSERFAKDLLDEAAGAATTETAQGPPASLGPSSESAEDAVEEELAADIAASNGDSAPAAERGERVPVGGAV